MKTKRINVRVTETEKEILKQAAEESGLTASILVRQAVKDKIKEIGRAQEAKQVSVPV